MAYVSVGAALGALFLGWIAGMWTFKRSDRWCPHCGATTVALTERHRHGEAR